MKVKYVIERLEKFDPELEVVCWTDRGEINAATDVVQGEAGGGAFFPSKDEVMVT